MKIDTTKGYLRIKVIPNSSRNEITEIMEDSDKNQTIKIRIKAAAERGKANKELIKFLSQYLEIPAEKVIIINGKTEALKLIKIQ